MIIAISASFVTCCMSINTADFLCQCIVHVLGIILSFCFSFSCWFYSLYCLFFFVFFWGIVFMSCPERQVCVQTEIVAPAVGGLLYSLLKKLRTKRRRRKKRETPGLFWWSCIRLHYNSIWCAICDIWMFPVYLCSLHPTREKKVE